MNFGAVVRSAHFLGVSGIVCCARNSAPLSAIMSKASAGAAEIAPIFACKSMSTFLKRSQVEGWDVLGADASHDEAIDVSAIRLARPTILVLGSEGFGLR